MSERGRGPRLTGEIHLVLVVRDRARSVAWYRRVLGFEVVREEVSSDVASDDGVIRGFTCTSLFQFHSGIFLGLATPNARDASPREWDRAGLQHVGLHVPEREDLTRWAEHLDALDVPHSEIEAEGPGLLVRFHDPDGHPIEVYWADRERGRELLGELARSRVTARARHRREGR